MNGSRWFIVVGSVCLMAGCILLCIFMRGRPSSQQRSSEPTTELPETSRTSPALDKYDQALRARLAQPQHEEPLEQLYGAIGAAKGQTVTEEVSREIANLREAGQDPVAGLGELYEREGSVQERTIIIRALQDVGTPQALAALKGIAVKPGRDAFTLGPRAVKAVAALTDDPDEISELLVSELPRVRNAAATALSGKELTDVTVRRLGGLLHSNSWMTHNLVSAAFLTDRSSATVARKVDIVLAALPQLEHLEDAQKIVPQMGFTARETALGQYIRGLGMMMGAGPILHKKLDGLTAGSLEHKAVVLALALRNDKIAYSSVLQIARTDKDGFVRLLAVEALDVVGSPQDIDLLESLANTDPYTRPSRTHSRDPERTVYPVRRAAKTVIGSIEKRHSKEPQK